MRDLAARLGVSTSTISRALNYHPSISERTRERILKAAQSNGYVVNSLARGLALKRSQLVGLIVPDITNPFFAEIARGAYDLAYRRSFVVALCDTQRSINREELFSKILLSSRVAGLILTSGVIIETRVRQWKRLSIPIVLAGRKATRGLSGVTVDNVAVGQQATQYLIQLRHEKILYLGGPPESPANQDRQRGYVESMREHGLSPVIVHGDYTMQSGFQHAGLLTKTGRRATAVFAANDMMAIGLMMALAGSGVKVPSDVSVVGCDDVPMSNLIKPTLTTVNVPMHGIGLRAMEMLLQMVTEGEAGPTQSILLGSRLIERESARER